MDAPRMKMDKNNGTQTILNLTLETIYLLTGEDYEVMKRTSGGGFTSRVPGGLNQTVNPSLPSKEQPKNDKKILELTNQVVHLLTGEVWKYLGQTTLGDYAKLEDCTSMRTHDASHDDPPNCSKEQSNFHAEGVSVPTNSTHHISLMPNGSEEAYLSDSNISTPSLIKEEPLSAEERLPQLVVSEPRQHTSQVDTLLPEDGHPGKLSIYSPAAQYTPFVIKEEKEEDLQHTDPNISANEMQAASPEISDESITLENLDANLTLTLENHFSASPNQEHSQQANPGEESYSHYNSSASAGGDFTKAGFSGTGEKPSDPQLSLGKHVTILRKGKTFFCSECGKSSSWRSVMVHHQRIHTGEKPFSCPECGKCFKTKSHLILHQRTHTGEKPYSCSECAKSFTCSSHLVTHRRIHTGEKPYSCSECGKSFISNSNLIQHQKCHSEDKPYSCPDCGKCYRYNSDLARHQKRQPGGKPYSCTECEMCYFSKCALAVHLKGHGLAPRVL